MEVSIVSGHASYHLKYYHEVIKKNPRLLEAKRERWRRYYYDHRHEISAKRKAKRIAQGGTNYRRHKPLKPSPIREQKFRRRRGHVEPVLNNYPRNRIARRFRTGDGVVV